MVSELRARERAPAGCNSYSSNDASIERTSSSSSSSSCLRRDTTPARRRGGGVKLLALEAAEGVDDAEEDAVEEVEDAEEAVDDTDSEPGERVDTVRRCAMPPTPALGGRVTIGDAAAAAADASMDPAWLGCDEAK